MTTKAACTCYLTDEKYWFRYGSAVEPGSQWEPNPDCLVHFPIDRDTPGNEVLTHAG